MSEILAPIKGRVLDFLDCQGFKKGEFFKRISASPSNFRSKSLQSEIGGDVIAKISSEFPELNITWLLSGEGEMLKEDIKAFPCKLGLEGNQIPLVDINAIGGFGNANFSIGDRDIKDYYVVPKFKDRKIDFMIEVYGSSMYPKYNSGDVVACKVIRESNFIQWNKVHVIATMEQGILIKRIKKGSDGNSLLAISDNKDYDPFEIPANEIDGIALVVGVIRLE